MNNFYVWQMPTMHGPIRARLNGTHRAGRFELGLTVPGETQATACVRNTAGLSHGGEEGRVDTEARLLLNGHVVQYTTTGEYMCIAGLTQRHGNAEHVLVRTR